ncbi:MAG: dipeptidase [Gammaproteobacteria bacterium]
MTTLKLMPQIACLLLGVTSLACAAEGAKIDPKALAIHERLIVLDTHLDTPAHLVWNGWSILDRHRVEDDGSQIDLPRMIAGGLDGGFFAVYTPQGPVTPEGDIAARDAGLLRALAIRELVARYPDRFELALKADDAAPIAARGHRIVFMSIENGYPFESDLTLMSTFYKMGVRLMSPVHFLNNRLGDSSTDPTGKKWNGLSDLGKRFVAEANRLGVVVDVSHSSDDVLDQAIQLSKTPVLLSHSGCKAVFNHPRNVDDDRLRALAASGGVIQVSAYSDYMVPLTKNAERDVAMAEYQKANRALANPTAAERKALTAQRRDIDKRFPAPRATFDDYMAHLLHALKVAGVDHVGVGIDFDGGGGVIGLDDATDYPRITERLLKEGYTEADLQKIWSGNVLRVLRAAESGAQVP